MIIENELYHHGILGMHWGIRRYQPYSVTGPRKGGKTGQEIGEAARKPESSHEVTAPSLSSKERKAKIDNIRKQQLKQERKEKRAAYKIAKAEKKEAKQEKRLVKTMAEFEKDKQKVLRSGDIDKIIAFNNHHRNLISNEELQTAITRIEKENALMSMVDARERLKKQKAMTKYDDIQKVITTTVKIGGDLTKGYDTFAKAYNTFNPDKKLKLISEDAKAEQEKELKKAKEAKEEAFRKYKDRELNSGDINRINKFNAMYYGEVSADDLEKALKKYKLLHPGK